MNEYRMPTIIYTRSDRNFNEDQKALLVKLIFEKRLVKAHFNKYSLRNLTEEEIHILCDIDKEEKLYCSNCWRTERCSLKNSSIYGIDSCSKLW